MIEDDRENIEEDMRTNFPEEYRPTKVVGPIYGVPSAEVLAWVNYPRPKEARAS